MGSGAPLEKASSGLGSGTGCTQTTQTSQSLHCRLGWSGGTLSLSGGGGGPCAPSSEMCTCFSQDPGKGFFVF